MLVGFASTHGGCFHYRAELPARSLPLYADRFPGGLVTVVGETLALNHPNQQCPIGITDDVDEEIPNVIVLAGGWPTIVGFNGIDAARNAGQTVVCDIDDYPRLPPTHPGYVKGAGARKLAALRAADAVTCSTPFLRDYLAEQEIGATLVRNSIDASRYELERYENVGRRNLPALNPEPLLTIGYRGLLCGFHDDDVRELSGCFDGIDGVRFVHIGADPREEYTFAELLGVKPELVEERFATEFDFYGPQLAGIDLALIPLANNAVNYAKSNIAALEWHAAGVPWLASPHPEFNEAGRGCGLVMRREHWRRYVERLRNPAQRETLYRDQSPAIPTGAEQWVDALLAAMRARA